MYTVAVEWGEADFNPVTAVRKPKQGRRRVVEPLAPEAVEAIRAEMLAADDFRSATMVSVLAYAGLRPGEMLALEPRHVRERTLLIDQAVAHGRLKVQKTGRIYRTVDLFPLLHNDLLAWQGVRGRAGLLPFGRDDGDPWRLDDWNNWRNRCFHKASKAAGLGLPRPYDLRHSFASLLIREQRQSVVDLADQLGHAPTMTLDTYSHVMREHRGDAQPREAEGWIREARRNAGTV
jgi:integrase